MNTYDDLLTNTLASEQNTQLSKEEYAAKKKEERDNLFAMSDNAAMEVAASDDKFKLYLDTQSKFDRYSAVNALLIMAQMPEASRLADFDHWKNKGGFIKGQTAISILEPQEYTKEDGTPGIGYNVKKVFDISQVDDRNMKPLKTTPTYNERQLLSALVSKAPMKIIGVEDLPYSLGAMIDKDTGELRVRKGMEFADTFSSIAQELGHYESCQDTHNPSFIGYSAAYILCKKYGIDTQKFDFYNSPNVFMDLDPQGVKSQLALIREAVGTISERMAKQLEAPEKNARNTEAR